MTTLTLTALLLAASSAVPSTAGAPGPRPFVTATVAVPVVAWSAPAGSSPAQLVTAVERLSATQLVGLGLVAHPRVRLSLLGLFSGTFTGLPAGANPWQLGAVVGLVQTPLGPLLAGAGPVLAFRSGGRNQPNLGAVVMVSLPFALGHGFVASLSLPLSAQFLSRFAVSAGLGAGLTWVF